MVAEEPKMVPDPGERALDPVFRDALVARYADKPVEGGITLTEEQYIETFGNLCDVVAYLLYQEAWNLPFDDDVSHTGDVPRAVAGILMEAAGFAEVELSPPGSASAPPV